MNVLLYLLVPVIIAAMVIGLNVWRQRRPRSIEASVREFRDGLDALDPVKSPMPVPKPPMPTTKRNGERPTGDRGERKEKGRD
jgi:hypothetical protein